MTDGMPVVDAIVHPYKVSPEKYERDWPMEDVVAMSFLESYADLAAYHVLPIGAFHDGICGIDKALEVLKGWPQRFFVYAGVDPMLVPGVLGRSACLRPDPEPLGPRRLRHGNAPVRRSARRATGSRVPADGDDPPHHIARARRRTPPTPQPDAALVGVDPRPGRTSLTRRSAGHRGSAQRGRLVHLPRIPKGHP